MTAARPMLVDSRALARILAVSVPTVRELAREERIPALVVGGRRRFDVGEVIAALRKQQKPAPRRRAGRKR